MLTGFSLPHLHHQSPFYCVPHVILREHFLGCWSWWGQGQLSHSYDLRAISPNSHRHKGHEWTVSPTPTTIWQMRCRAKWGASLPAICQYLLPSAAVYKWKDQLLWLPQVVGVRGDDIFLLSSVTIQFKKMAFPSQQSLTISLFFCFS